MVSEGTEGLRSRSVMDSVKIQASADPNYVVLEFLFACPTSRFTYEIIS